MQVAEESVPIHNQYWKNKLEKVNNISLHLCISVYSHTLNLTDKNLTHQE